MPKASLLNDDDRDQLLKELAFGIPIYDLTQKYNLKPMQIEYQRGNNSALYNFYVDYFCIKPEILEWEESDLYRFILNILYGKVRKVNYKFYEYKGKLYKVHELIPEVNKILEREGLPLIGLGKPVRVRYTNKRTADQQIDKSDLPEIIRKMKLDYAVVVKKSGIKKVNIIDGLLKERKRINWKFQLISETGDEDLPCLRCWYRLWTEGKNRQRGGKRSEMSYLLRFLDKHGLLENNYFDIHPSTNEKYYKVLTLKPGVTKTKKFTFNGFAYMKKIESFINKFCLGLPLEALPVCFELALKSEDSVIKKNSKTLKKDLASYFNMCDEFPLPDEVVDELTIERLCEIIEGE